MTERSEVWRNYLESSILLQTKLDEQLRADAGMTLLEYHLLVLLINAPEQRLKMGELARGMVFSSSRLTYQVGVLEKRGWVQREKDPTDARVTFACLTAAGRAAFRDASGGHSRAVSDYFLGELSAAETKVLDRVFGRLQARLRDGAE